MRKPHLRLAIVNECNMACIYCREGGEGIKCKDVMSKEEIFKILNIASEMGFSYLKITGGEPLIREERYHDLFDIISYASKRKLFLGIGMVTNGLLLGKYIENIMSCGLNSLTVSLDAANAKLFESITGNARFDEIVRNIKTLKEKGMKININTVVSSININDIPNLIKLVNEIGVDLKLIDYVEFEENREKNTLKYVPFTSVYDYLDSLEINDEKRLEFPYGGLGTPMSVYSLSKESAVYIKDATEGTNYSEECKNCKNYPCQDALISIRITADGQLKK